MPPTSASAVIDLDLPGHQISRHVYGHFAEHLTRQDGLLRVSLPAHSFVTVSLALA